MEPRREDQSVEGGRPVGCKRDRGRARRDAVDQEPRGRPGACVAHAGAYGEGAARRLGNVERLDGRRGLAGRRGSRNRHGADADPARDQRRRGVGRARVVGAAIARDDHGRRLVVADEETRRGERGREPRASALVRRGRRTPVNRGVEAEDLERVSTGPRRFARARDPRRGCGLAAPEASRGFVDEEDQSSDGGLLAHERRGRERERDGRDDGGAQGRAGHASGTRPLGEPLEHEHRDEREPESRDHEREVGGFEAKVGHGRAPGSFRARERGSGRPSPRGRGCGSRRRSRPRVRAFSPPSRRSARSCAPPRRP